MKRSHSLNIYLLPRRKACRSACAGRGENTRILFPDHFQVILDSKYCSHILIIIFNTSRIRSIFLAWRRRFSHSSDMVVACALITRSSGSDTASTSTGLCFDRLRIILRGKEKVCYEERRIDRDFTRYGNRQRCLSFCHKKY